ncbi:hypothetical protein DWF00_27980 [Bosea caraganae]|uniref:Uncharacterized protein n=1 Tax=Bosea caraganae TaxID=2763117 RepID=A0A370KYW6_9HYPH|nr:hypothetical protein [Bosea caraganae]RDJ20178.1 hypothetical protein DWE98_25575 [Bosea caraganae]RDJ21210.1 hypothetical protein DWF00_27980 [Bosea caraganae]
MSDERAGFLAVFRAHLGDWFERAFPAELGQRPGEARASDDDEAGDARRQSIHDVTLEQLGISHWSCHTHF